MRNQNEWFSYSIEFLIVAIFFIFNFSKIQSRFRIDRKYIFHILITITLGFSVAKLSQTLNLPSPFDFQDYLFWLQLVVIAPFLEEALFRLLLWDAIKKFCKSTNVLIIIIIISILFSLSHFAAYQYVPKEFHNFILFQSAYTFILGIYWGFVRRNYNSWLASVALHVLFNLCFGIEIHLAF
jgi:membrane protease YdiL (CAAX protease family)